MLPIIGYCLRRSGGPWVVAIIICACIGFMLAISERESSIVAGEGRSCTAICRSPENDGANCLFLQLCLLGYGEGYERFRDRLPSDSAGLTLKDMAAIGRRLGFCYTPVKLTVSELVCVRSPVILHFETHGVNSGRFMLFLWMAEDEATFALIDGAQVTFRELSRDEFRRTWTGYGLIGRPPVDLSIWVRRSAAAVVCAALCSLLAIRVRGFSRRFASFSGGFDR